MTLQLNRFKINVEEYYKMAEVGILKPTDRVELIEGELITMSPIKSPHAGVVTALIEELVPLLNKKYTTTSQSPITIDKYSEPEPDFLIAKYRKDRYRKKHPSPKDIFIVIEVSDSTLKIDRQIKLPLYAKALIPEYWIIDVKKQQIEQYTQPKDEKYKSKKIIKKTGTIKPSTVDFSLKVADLFY